MRVALHLLGTEVVAVEWGEPAEAEEPRLQGAPGGAIYDQAPDRGPDWSVPSPARYGFDRTP